MEDDKIETRTYLKMNFTADYRFFNPRNASSIFKDIHLYGEDPQKFEDECKKYGDISYVNYYFGHKK